MNRLFTFGCSFTNYKWPTWADILSLNYDYFENWAKIGAGNHFIFYRLVECITKNKIHSTDTVVIMWTSFAREDRWVNGEWLCYGSVYNSGYGDNFVKNFTDPDGYLIQNLAIIQATKNILDAIGCNYTFLSVVPHTVLDDSYKKLPLNFRTNVEKQCTQIYSNVLQKIYPSVYKVVFNNDWNSRSDFDIPLSTKEFNKEFEQAYAHCQGKDWPSFDDYISNNLSHVKPKIINEIDKEFMFEERKKCFKSLRKDFHPTPLEHLEYLEAIKLIDPTPAQIKFTADYDTLVKTKDNFSWSSKDPKNTL